MDFLQEFNWDDIVVGDNRLDHSENFFAEKHIEHEKFEGMDNFIHEFAEKISLNILEKHKKLINDNMKDDKENINDNIDQSENDGLDKTLIKPTKPNLATQWSGRIKIVKSHISSTKINAEKSLPPTPEAYKIHFVYKKKHEETKRRLLEVERKKLEFHPRPMPNFNKGHEQNKKRLPKFTLPVTPQLLKNYYKAQEVRKRKMLEKKPELQSVKFTSSSADVLREKPFAPQKKKPTRIEQKPFSLHCEERVQQRKQFDEAFQRHLAEKRKQAEQKRKELEEEQIKALRKAATFKARPNPFKH